IMRAFIGDLGDRGRPQGGSTITQQVVKNLLVGGDVTYERKIRELIVASRLEDTLSKEEILELYLNSVYLGRDSWGIERAARDYFGKSARNLTLTEGGTCQGAPVSPDRHGRPREFLSAEDHSSGCGDARHRACNQLPFTLCRWQDRYDRGCGRRLV